MKHIDHALVAKPHTSEYLMHKYWARKPHNVVAEYIKNYSKTGDIILDPFVGSGVTAIEALKLGRKAVAIDLDPLATFITHCTAIPLDLIKFNNAFEKLKGKLAGKIHSLYETSCPKCKRKTVAEAIIWNSGKPIDIRYSCSCTSKVLWKTPAVKDEKLLKHISRKPIPYWYPKNELIHNTRINVHPGTGVYDLFTRRNLIALSTLFHEIEGIEDRKIRDLMLFTFSSALPQASKLVFVIRRPGRERQVGSWATRGYWVPDEFFEINAWNCFEERFKKVLRGKEETNKLIPNCIEGHTLKDLKNDANLLILNQSSLSLKNLPSESIDYIFTDPPYGDSVPYLELDYMWNSWLKFSVTWEDEIIISDSPVRKKDFVIYEKMLRAAFAEAFRVLKPGKYLTVTFHNTDIKIWNSIISAVTLNGFDLEKIIFQPPARPSAKGLLAPYGSAIGDYYIRFKKPLHVIAATSSGTSPERYERVIVQSAKAIIARRCEPTPYTYILNGIIPELKKAGALLLGSTNPDKILIKHLGKEFKLVDVKDAKGKVVGQKWWLQNPDELRLDVVPLADRVEAAIVDILNRKVKVSFDDVLQEIFIKFPNALTPETQDVRDVLAEYANETKDGNWMLKPLVRDRASQHSEIIFMLGDIGRKLGFDLWVGSKEQSALYKGKRLSELIEVLPIDTRNFDRPQVSRIENIDLLWHTKGKIQYAFEVENTTSITEALVRGANIPYQVNRFIVIPEERATLLDRKLKEPGLEEMLKKNPWERFYYSTVEDFYNTVKTKKCIEIKMFERLVGRKANIDSSGQRLLLI